MKKMILLGLMVLCVFSLSGCNAFDLLDFSDAKYVITYEGNDFSIGDHIEVLSEKGYTLDELPDVLPANKYVSLNVKKGEQVIMSINISNLQSEDLPSNNCPITRISIYDVSQEFKLDGTDFSNLTKEAAKEQLGDDATLDQNGLVSLTTTSRSVRILYNNEIIQSVTVEGRY